MNKRRFVRKLRDLQGDMPLQAFARKLGIDASYLSRLYRGERSPGARAIEGALRAFPRVSLKEWGFTGADGPRSCDPARRDAADRRSVMGLDLAAGGAPRLLPLEDDDEDGDDAPGR